MTTASERVLICGAGGQLGGDLATALAGLGDVVALDRSGLDVTDAVAVQTVIADLHPTLVVNCAAWVAVDACETDLEGPWRLNAAAVAHLARASAAAGARLVHYSTNYVFDGLDDEPYVESDAPSPRSIYAITKLAGEHAALAYCPGALVIRTAGLYGARGNRSKGGSFVQRIIAGARANGRLAVVADQRLAPTATADLAAATRAALAAGAAGTLHLTSSGACSWHEFATRIVANAGLDVPIEATTTEPAPGRAQRPANGVLGSSRLAALGLPPLPTWQDALDAHMADTFKPDAANAAGE